MICYRVLLLLLPSLPPPQEAFDAQSFVSRLLGFGDMRGLVQQIQESQEESGDPKEMMCVWNECTGCNAAVTGRADHDAPHPNAPPFGIAKFLWTAKPFVHASGFYRCDRHGASLAVIPWGFFVLMQKVRPSLSPFPPPRERMSKGQFTLRDLYKHLSSAMKLGPMSKVMGMIPGMGDMSQVMSLTILYVSLFVGSETVLCSCCWVPPPLLSSSRL